MKRILLYTLIFSSTLLFAGHGWQRINHMQSTIFSAHVTINGKPTQVGNIVAAFTNNECRMITNTFINNDSTFVSSVIHGDVPETISFKLWIQEKDTIINATETVSSVPGGSLLFYQLNFVMD